MDRIIEQGELCDRGLCPHVGAILWLGSQLLCGAHALAELGDLPAQVWFTERLRSGLLLSDLNEVSA